MQKQHEHVLWLNAGVHSINDEQGVYSINDEDKMNESSHFE